VFCGNVIHSPGLVLAFVAMSIITFINDPENLEKNRVEEWSRTAMKHSFVS
jgi:hypothetical protein